MRPCYQCKHSGTEGWTTVCKRSARDPLWGLRKPLHRARGSDTCKPEPTLLIRLKELL